MPHAVRTAAVAVALVALSACGGAADSVKDTATPPAAAPLSADASPDDAPDEAEEQPTSPPDAVEPPSEPLGAAMTTPEGTARVYWQAVKDQRYTEACQFFSAEVRNAFAGRGLDCARAVADGYEYTLEKLPAVITIKASKVEYQGVELAEIPGEAVTGAKSPHTITDLSLSRIGGLWMITNAED